MSKVYGILLTLEGWEEVGDALAPYTNEGRIGKYIYASRVLPDGPFFVFKSETENSDGGVFRADISIPHRFVKFVISASQEANIGFA